MKLYEYYSCMVLSDNYHSHIGIQCDDIYVCTGVSCCCRLSDASGSMNFDLVAEGEISKDMLDTNVSVRSFLLVISVLLAVLCLSQCTYFYLHVLLVFDITTIWLVRLTDSKCRQFEQYTSNSMIVRWPSIYFTSPYTFARHDNYI